MVLSTGFSVFRFSWNAIDFSWKNLVSAEKKFAKNRCTFLKHEKSFFTALHSMEVPLKDTFKKFFFFERCSKKKNYFSNTSSDRRAMLDDHSMCLKNIFSYSYIILYFRKIYFVQNKYFFIINGKIFFDFLLINHHNCINIQFHCFTSIFFTI